MNEHFAVPNFDVDIEQIKLHLATGAAATAEVNFPVSQYTSASSPYNVNIITQAMAGVVDYVWNDGPVTIPKGSELNLVWVNDTASYKQWGLEILYDIV
jgi:hypothetical protein